MGTNFNDSIPGALQKLKQELKKDMERTSLKQFKKANKNFKPAFELVMTEDNKV